MKQNVLIIKCINNIINTLNTLIQTNIINNILRFAHHAFNTFYYHMFNI